MQMGVRSSHSHSESHHDLIGSTKYRDIVQLYVINNVTYVTYRDDSEHRLSGRRRLGPFLAADNNMAD